MVLRGHLELWCAPIAIIRASYCGAAATHSSLASARTASWSIAGTGAIYSNNSTSANLGAMASGDVVSFAIDLNARKAWVRRERWQLEQRQHHLAEPKHRCWWRAGAFAGGSRTYDRVRRRWHAGRREHDGELRLAAVRLSDADWRLRRMANGSITYHAGRRLDSQRHAVEWRPDRNAHHHHDQLRRVQRVLADCR